jgi:DNA-binding NarL/FixJ family response regulator
MTAPLRVFVADDHPIVRGGLRAVIDGERDMVVVGEAADGLAAVEAVTALRPDVVVMDLSMPKLDGIEASRRIKEACSDIKVIALTADHDPARLKRSLSAGTSGYVLKRAGADDLVRAIRAVAEGGMYLDPHAAAAALAQPRAPSGEVESSVLSERETEVLRMIAEGYAMKEIAAQLDVSARTLETYRQRAMDKLGLRSRADIVRYAMKQGWLTTH